MPWFWKKGPDCIHLCVKFFCSKCSFKSLRTLLVFLTKCLSKCPNSTKPPLPWKISGCTPDCRTHAIKTLWCSKIAVIDSSSATLLKRSFHQGGVPVNTKNFQCFSIKVSCELCFRENSQLSTTVPQLYYNEGTWYIIDFLLKISLLRQPIFRKIFRK